MADPVPTALPPLPSAALEALLDRSGALIYTFDGEGRLHSVNAAMRAALELPAAELVDLPALLRLLYPDPELRTRIEAAQAAALAGEPPRPAEWLVTSAAGEVRRIRWSFTAPTDGVAAGVGEDVSDRRNLERWVRLQNALLGTIRDAIVVADAEGRVLHWTGGAERLFGVDESAALGRPLARFLPGDNGATTVSEWVARAREQGTASLVCELVREGGESFDGAVDLARVLDDAGALTGIALVIAPARATPGSLPEAEGEAPGLEAALAGIGGAAVILTSMDGVVSTWSAGAERLGTMTAGRARGQKVLDAVLKVTGLSWDGLATRLATRPKYATKAVVERTNGTRVPVDLDAVLLRGPQGPLGVLLTLVDRSDVLALAEEAVHTKARALPGAVGEGLVRRLADTLTWFEPDHRVVHARLHDLVALGQLVAGGAPPAAIEAFVSSMPPPPGGDGAWDALDRLGDGVARLRALVDDLVRFETTEADTPGPVRVAREVEAARLLVGHRVAATAELVVHLEDLPPARASRAPMLRALALLLLAAGESCAEGEGGRVTVEGRHTHGWVNLEIRDNGAGYPIEVQSRLADTTWLAAQPGHAPYLLGLAREAARLAGGTLELSTAPGTGAKVKLSFPAAEGAAAVQPLDAPRSSAVAHGRVLLVEGDELLRRGLERFIAEYHQVAAFPTLADALPALAGTSFDGAVVSLTRPEALGLKLLHTLTEVAPGLQKNVIVLVPGSIRSATRDALVDRGHLVLPRPFDLTTLRSLLLRLIPPEELALDEALDASE